MKKYSTLTPFFAAAAFSLITSTASADPERVQADFTCPNISMVSNFGNYIAGLGMELILGQHNPVYFKTINWPAGVPANLGNYTNSATSYDSTKATVTCSYASTDPAEQAFDISYYVTNGYGGRIRQQTNSTIYIIFPLGFHN